MIHSTFETEKVYKSQVPYDKYHAYFTNYDYIQVEKTAAHPRKLGLVNYLVN